MKNIVGMLRAEKLNDSAGDDLDQLLEEAAIRIEKLQLELHLAALQIEYLEEKFQKTGTSAAMLARINAVLAE